MNTLKTILVSLIAGVLITLAGVSLFDGIYQAYKPDPPQSESVTTIITVPGDEEPEIEYLPEPYPVYRDTGSARWIHQPIDTMAILQDYLSRNAYRRVLKDDSSAFIAINDTVTRNRLTAFSFEFQNRRPTTVIQTTLTAPIRQEWILSGTVSLAIVPEKTRLMGGLMLTDFKQRSYFVKTDMSLKAWEGGVSLPVWRWCRKRERE
jgi:hypothetical protein